MERRTAIIAATTISLSVVAAGAAVSVAGGILDESPPSDGIGSLEPASFADPLAGSSTTTTGPEVVTVYVDEPVPAPTAPATAVTSDGAAIDDDRYEDDDLYEDDDEHDDHEHEGEHEGRDDDD